MKVLRLGTALALAAVLPAAAHAQVSGNFQWVSAGSAFSATFKKTALPSNNNTTVLAGAAYRANFKIPAPAGNDPYLPPHGTNNFGGTVDIYCVDFTHTAKSTYSAWFTKLDGTPLTRTRSSNLQTYLKAAWLVTKMNSYGLTTAADKFERASIHAAIWYQMAGTPISVLNGASYDASRLNYWYGQAQMASNWGTVNGVEWTVVTDACVSNGGTAGAGHSATDNCSQEFLTQNVVPEPATMILLGTGLLATLAMTGVLRRPTA